MAIDFNDPTEFETIFRPNYEMKQVFLFAMGAVFYSIAPFFSSAPSFVLWALCAIFIALACYKAPKAMHIYRIHQSLLGKKLDCCTLKDLEDLAKRDVHKDEMWLGKGFTWETKHTQRVSEILRCNWSAIVKEAKGNRDRMSNFKRRFLSWSGLRHPILMNATINEEGKLVADDMGQPWIHGMEANDDDMWQKIKHVEGHTLIVGTTGSGKTRMFDLFISQAILRGEPVFIIDPKGDEDLKMNAKRACEALGRSDAFLVFDPAKPRESIRINPLANWAVVSEIADRAMSIFPSKDPGDPFYGRSWGAVNAIAQGMMMCKIRPTLKSIRSEIEVINPKLLNLAIMNWAVSCLGEAEAKQHFNQMSLGDLSLEEPTRKLTRFYKTVLKESHDSPTINGLISLYQGNVEHLEKMIANLAPALAKVTSGELGNLLSPPNNNTEAAELNYRDFADLIANKNVVYIALSSLQTSEVASAIGSMMLSDLKAVAGARYAYDPQRTPVNIFVDEASEVANDSLIQMLNKGRGAGFRLFVATQTFADFSVRLGKSDKAEQVLSNLNNIFALRTINDATQKFLISVFPKVKVKYVQRDQGQRLSNDNPLLSDGSIGERLMEEESDMIPQTLLGMLPNLEYFASVSGGHIIKGRIPILVANRKEFRG